MGFWKSNPIFWRENDPLWLPLMLSFMRVLGFFISDDEDWEDDDDSNDIINVFKRYLSLHSQ